MSEPKEIYTPSGEVSRFLSSKLIQGYEHGKLGSDFGNWTFKVIAKRQGEVMHTLTTDFEYNYFNSVIDNCRLRDQASKTCEFFGSNYTITKGKGCGTNPVEINIKNSKTSHNLEIAQGGKAILPGSSIVVRNMGATCMVNALSLVFELPIQSEKAFISASTRDKSIKTKINGTDKSFTLPLGEKTKIIEARVQDENQTRKISIESNNKGESFLIKSLNSTQETDLDIIIKDSKLYLETNGTDFELNYLLDTATKKLENEFDSIENIKMIDDSVTYSATGIKDGEYIEVQLDGTTGEIKNILGENNKTPSQSMNETDSNGAKSNIFESLYETLFGLFI